MFVVPRRLVAWHHAFWMTPAPVAAGVCRIVLAVVFTLFLCVNLPADYRAWAAGRAVEFYDPIGVLALYGSGGPPVDVLVAAHWAAKVGVGFLLVGLFTRLSLAVVTVAMLHCCGAGASFHLAISHSFNPVLIAAAGLLAGARSPLSVDYLLAGRDRAGYWETPRVGVMLAMFAVGWSFANAGLHKIYLGNGKPFAWCYSDNLRNILLFQHLKWGKPVPGPLAWVLERPWAYKTLAFGHVACQLLPVAGPFLVRRPRIRLVLAGLVLAEVLGLGFVMGMWRGYGDIWLLLPLLFIDWDAGWAGPVAAGADRWWRARRAWAVALAGSFVVISCWPGQIRTAYPLMSFDMFSYLLVAEPYAEHRPHLLVLNVWEVEATPPLLPGQAADVWTRFHVGRAGPDRVRNYCEATFGVRVDSVRGTKRCFMFPPPPRVAVDEGPGERWVTWERATGAPARSLAAGPPRLTPGPGGGWRCRLTLTPAGLEPADLRFEYTTIGAAGAVPVTAVARGKWEYDLDIPPGARGVVFLTARVRTAAGADEMYYVGHVRVTDW